MNSNQICRITFVSTNNSYSISCPGNHTRYSSQDEAVMAAKAQNMPIQLRGQFTNEIFKHITLADLDLRQNSNFNDHRKHLFATLEKLYADGHIVKFSGSRDRLHITTTDLRANHIVMCPSLSSWYYSLTGKELKDNIPGHTFSDNKEADEYI